MNIETPKNGEVNYASLIEKAKEKQSVDKYSLMHVQGMASIAGITLQEKGVAPRVALYEVLKADAESAKVVGHLGGLIDQRVFAEVLRLLKDTESLAKLKSAYPRIFPEGK